MAAVRPSTVAFTVEGPIARADLPGLCDRVCAVLAGSEAEVALCDVGTVEPDAVTVDALARLQLAARRHGCRVRLRGASPELRELVEFMGLTDVLPDRPSTRPDEEETMARQIYVNLAVEDLDRSVAFFTDLGFTFDPQFTDETATCMIVGGDAFVMLLVESRFKDFTKKALADPTAQTEAILAVSAESREEVDELADRALAAGGSPANDPMDLGFMYSRSFQDPDGHLWELVWMDPSGPGA
jgi:uncharacterized protein